MHNENVHVHNRILLCYKEKGNYDICQKVDGIRNSISNWSNQDPERQTHYVVLSVDPSSKILDYNL